MTDPTREKAREIAERAKALLDAGVSPWPWHPNGSGGLRTRDGAYLSESMAGWSSPRGGELRDRDVELASLAPELATALIEALSTPSPEPLREALEEAREALHYIFETSPDNHDSRKAKEAIAKIDAALAASPLSVEMGEVERVAKAIAACDNEEGWDAWEYNQPSSGEIYREYARAAIAALRSSGIDGGE